MKKNILICTYTKFPDGSATAVRVTSFIQMLKRLGHEVDLVTMNDRYSDVPEKSLDGVTRYNYRLYHSRHPFKVINYFLYGFFLKKLLERKNYDVVIDMGLPYFSFLYVKRQVSLGNLNLVFDAIDWYSAFHYRFGFFSFNYLFRELKLKYGIGKNIRAICISRYFEGYFIRKNVLTTYIPFVFDMSRICYEKKIPKENFFKFIYAGVPGKKDLIYPFFNGLALLTVAELGTLHFDLYGVDDRYLREYAVSFPEQYLKIQQVISCHGVVSRSTIKAAFYDADFSVLFRDFNARHAKAGFPTKMSESLSFGTPVFCNLTSDMGTFLQDRYNAIILPDYCNKTVVFNIRRVLQLSCDARSEMYRNAYETARQSLSSDLYMDNLAFIVDF